MVRNQFYYFTKPMIPRALRIAVRRWIAGRKRRHVTDTWPVKPGSEQPPEGWPGWPHGKQFSLVLTHDVEGREGVLKCRQLMQLELKYGFRSSFNFVPEGGYAVPRELREDLTRNGFEVGVHDLQHDGRLYSSRQGFSEKAKRINHYLKDWGASGFRSAFMMHDLEWLNKLNIEYDASTFDTDPFEPQPDGVNTIFPFWVSGGNGHGYVELPYTLPQDFTLFVLFREQTIDIWQKKIDWIAKHGGMALINIHPDYIDFTGKSCAHKEYSAALLEGFLQHISTRFSGRYWNPRPCELANWYSRTCGPNSGTAPRISKDLSRSDMLEPCHGSLRGKRAAVLLFSHYPSDPRPRRAAEALVNAGMQVDLICLRENAAEPKREVVGGVNLLRIPLRKRRDGKLSYILQYSAFLIGCAAILTARMPKRRYDLVHAHNMPDFLVFSALVPKWFGARVILDLHDPMPELMMSIYKLRRESFAVRVLNRLEKWSIQFADSVLTVNLACKKLFSSRSGSAEKIHVIMNAPDEQIFEFQPSKSNGPTQRDSTKTFVIMYHGSLVERNGLELAVKAVEIARNTIPKVELRIFGSPTRFLERVMKSVRERGLTEVVHHLGPRTIEQIAVEIENCDVGVIPNLRSEFTEINTPTRIFEYLACGKPVIAPKAQGIQDYFGGQDIILFELGDDNDLALKIEYVFSHPSEVDEIVRRGQQVYLAHKWSQQRLRLLNLVGELFGHAR